MPSYGDRERRPSRVVPRQIQLPKATPPPQRLPVPTGDHSGFNILDGYSVLPPSNMLLVTLIETMELNMSLTGSVSLLNPQFYLSTFIMPLSVLELELNCCDT